MELRFASECSPLPLDFDIATVETTLKNFGADYIGSTWRDDVTYCQVYLIDMKFHSSPPLPSSTFFQLNFSPETSVEKFVLCQQDVEQDLAIALGGAASCASMRSLHIKVEAQLYLVAPNLQTMEAIITKVTADNISTCYAVWMESKVFEFGSVFRTYLNDPESGASRGIWS